MTVADADLLAAHCRGDADSFAELFLRHRNRMWAVALRITADPVDAADVVQDAVIRAMRASCDFRGECAVATWLHRIVTNAAIDFLRRRHPVVGLDEVTLASQAEAWPPQRWPEASVALSVDLERAFQQLPVEQRLAVYLVDYEGWPIAEAAAALGCAQGTIKSRCARGRQRLAKILVGYRNQLPITNVKQDGGEVNDR